MKIIVKFLEIFKPYVDEIEDPTIRDIARVVIPAVSGILFVWLVSLPFTLISEIITAIVTIVTTAG